MKRFLRAYVLNSLDNISKHIMSVPFSMPKIHRDPQNTTFISYPFRMCLIIVKNHTSKKSARIQVMYLNTQNSYQIE